MSAFRFHVVCPFHTTQFGVGSDLVSANEFLDAVRAHVGWAEDHGIHGMVLYAFQASLDPFATAAAVLQSSRTLRPIVTVLPHQIHPTAAARAIATLGYLYDRGIDLNMVGGASARELQRVGESGDKRASYDRLAEYVSVLRPLLQGNCTYRGRYYQLEDYTYSPSVPPDRMPCIFVPGSSEESAPVVRDHADSSLLMAKPLARIREEVTLLSRGPRALRHGMIVGIVARETDEAAWASARNPQGDERRARAVAKFFVAQTTSQQHRANAALAKVSELHDDVLWYGGASIGIDCPKLVGGYARVRDALHAYREVGVTDIVIDLPRTLTDYEHVARLIDAL